MIDGAAPADAARDWVEIERAQPGMWIELQRLGRRARLRWALTLLLALTATALAVGVASRRPRSYESRIVFHVTEGMVDRESAPHTNGRLREYVAQVVFSTQRLVDVIKEHDLYPSLMAHDASLAVESMRDDIDVEVARNYFATARSADDPQRSARLGVAFHGNNAQKTFAVVRHLGRLITEHEQRSRMQQSEAALRFEDDQAQQARDLVLRRKRGLVEADLARQQAVSPQTALMRLMEERDLEKSLPRAEQLLAKAERRREKAYLRVQLEKRSMGLRFDLVDGGRVEPEGMSRRLLLAAIGIAVFLLALPLCCIAVGAFDSLIYDLDDIRRLGLGTLGAVRRFDGDNTGALTARLRQNSGARLGQGSGARLRQESNGRMDPS